MFKYLVSCALIILTIFVVDIYEQSPYVNYSSTGKADVAHEHGSIDTKINHRDRMARLIRRAVRIEYVCGMTETGHMGSGVVIKHKDGKTLVATAEHVTAAIERKDCDIVVKDWLGMSGYGDVIRKDENTDISVIEVGEEIGEAAGLYRGAYLGQAISCVGWPMIPYNDVDRMSITRGYVTTMDVNGFLRISADVFFGNSGGACFSKKGHVVGIVSYFLVGGNAFGLPTPRPGQFYISDVENLKNLLDR